MIDMVADIHKAKIKVFGVGGGGGNTVNCLHRKDVEGVELYLLNTDKQALNMSQVANKIGLGKTLTRGLGTGGNPGVGKEAALETEGLIRNLIKGTDLLFLAMGMGGGTGTGASPEIGRIAKEEGILTVAVVTLPFTFEGKRRMGTAEKGLEELKEYVDTSIIIENQKILPLISKTSSVHESFGIVDDILCKAVMAITDLITKQGLINLDFADVKTILTGGGSAFMVTGAASGQNRSGRAASMAITSHLMKRSSLEGARKIIINISGSLDMTLDEVKEATSIVHDKADDECHIIMGAVVDESLGDELRVTVVATEFQDEMEGEHEETSYRKKISIGGNDSKVENPFNHMKIPSTVMTQYESATGRKFVMQESNLDCPTFLRNKKKASFSA